MDVEDKWHTRMPFSEIAGYFIAAVMLEDGDYQVVCGFPKLDEEKRIVIRVNGRDIPVLEPDGNGGWGPTHGVVSVKHVYRTVSYEQVGPEDIHDGDEPVYVGDAKVLGLRKRPMPTEPGLYLDGYGETWVLTDCEEWQKWDFPDGSYEQYSKREAVDFAPFTPAKAVER